MDSQVLIALRCVPAFLSCQIKDRERNWPQICVTNRSQTVCHIGNHEHVQTRLDGPVPHDVSSMVFERAEENCLNITLNPFVRVDLWVLCGKYHVAYLAFIELGNLLRIRDTGSVCSFYPIFERRDRPRSETRRAVQRNNHSRLSAPFAAWTAHFGNLRHILL